MDVLLAPFARNDFDEIRGPELTSRTQWDPLAKRARDSNRQSARCRSACAQFRAACARCVQCEIRLSRELSGEGPEVKRLSARHVAAASPCRGLRARGRRRTRHCCHRVADGGAECKRLRGRWVAGELGLGARDHAAYHAAAARHASADDGQPGLQPAGLLPAGLGFGQGGDAVCVPLRCVPCSRHGNTCILLRMGLLRLFDGKADIVDLVLRHFHGASGWDKARFDARMFCVQYGPAGDVIAIGDADGFIHLICAQTGEKILRLKGHR
jgi:hypothetical protein